MAAIELEGRFPVHTRADLYLITLILEACDIDDITLELSEREIYNDIRAETSQTAGFEESYATKVVVQDVCSYPPQLAAQSSQDITVSIESGDTEVTWIGIVRYSCVGETITGIGESACDALGGQWRDVHGGMCTFGSMTEYMEVTPIGQTSTTFTFRVTNHHDTLMIRYSVDVSYRYLAIRTMQVRSLDENSIAKYGRRVMNLIWSLGQSPNTAQQMADTYKAKYSEPVPIPYIAVLGKTERLMNFVLAAKVNGRFRIKHAGLGIDHDYWVNQINPIHRTEGLLEMNLDLEQVRTLEQYLFFKLDTSLLDSAHVLA